MDADLLGIIVTAIQVIVLLVLVYGMVGHIKNSKVDLPAILFMFSMFSFLLNDIYWLCFDILYSGEKMPFSVNAIGEYAFMMLLVSMYKQLFDSYKLRISLENMIITVMTAIYMCLWIRWSGTWTGNIIGAVAFGYLVCIIVGLMIEYEPIPAKYLYYIMYIAIAQLMLNLMAEFVTSGPVTATVNNVMYAVTYVPALIFLAIITLRIIKKADNKGNLILTGGFIVWSFNAMYMSGDYWYELGDVLSTIATVYLYIEMKREGEKI